MADRPLAFTLPPYESDEAQGVTIRRTIGSERLIFLDPVFLCDHMFVAPGPEAQPVGFHRHPHRGIETLTLNLTGRMRHRDSLGNDDVIGPGAAQWMTAGAGIWHEEMLLPDAGGNEGLQLWFNLPRDRKRLPAAYRSIPAESVPEFGLGGAIVRLVAGQIGPYVGPASGIQVKPTVAVVRLMAGTTVELPTPAGSNALVYGFRGTILADANEIAFPQLVVFGSGEEVGLANPGEEDAVFAFVAAPPLDEPVLQYRSLVMNTVDDIGEAVREIADGTFANESWSDN